MPGRRIGCAIVPAGFDDLSLDALRGGGARSGAMYPADVLPAWVAEMDFPLAPPVRDALQAALDARRLRLPASRAAWPRRSPRFAARALGLGGRPRARAARARRDGRVAETLRVLTAPGDGVVINPPVYAPFFAAIARARPDGRRGAARGRPRPAGSSTSTRSSARSPAAPARTSSATRTTRPAASFARAELEARRRARRRATTSRVVSDEIHAPLTLAGRDAHAVRLARRGAGARAAHDHGRDEGVEPRRPQVRGARRRLGGDAGGARRAPREPPLPRGPPRRARRRSPRSSPAGHGSTSCVAYLDGNRRRLAELLAARLPEVRLRRRRRPATSRGSTAARSASATTRPRRSSSAAGSRSAPARTSARRAAASRA